jgi:hypothetical protein
MNTIHHTVTVESGRAYGGRIPPALCGLILTSLEDDLKRSISMAFRGASRVAGRTPRWLTAMSDVRFVGIEGREETTLHFDAPAFGSAAPELYAQSEFWPSRPSPDLTAFEALGSVLVDVNRENAESDRFDRPFLRRIAGFRKIASAGVRSVRVGAGSGAPLLDARSAAIAQRLAEMAPGAQRVKVVGRLDMLRASTETFALQLDSGEEVRGVCSGAEFTQLPALFGQRVAVDGLAIFRPSGHLLRIDADFVAVGEGVSSLFSRVPEPREIDVSVRALRKPQGPTTGVNAIFGRWPGEETDEEVAAALEELS